jgi:cytochrome c oxidase subunit IV
MGYIISTDLPYSLRKMMMNRQKTENNTYESSTVVWLVLVALTIVSFCLGETEMQGEAVMLTLLVITMIKSQLIANCFMGLHKTKLLWRGIMFSYFVVVGGLIALAYLKGMPTN